MINGDHESQNINIAYEGDIQKWTNYMHGWQVTSISNVTRFRICITELCYDAQFALNVIAT